MAQADLDGRAGMAGSSQGVMAGTMWYYGNGDPKKVILILGRSLSSLGAGMRPNLRMSRRLDLG